VADRFGPRWALSVGAAAGVAAALVGARFLARHGGLELGVDPAGPRRAEGDADDPSAAAAVSPPLGSIPKG
jgi:hypothetical protein